MAARSSIRQVTGPGRQGLVPAPASCRPRALARQTTGLSPGLLLAVLAGAVLLASACRPAVEPAASESAAMATPASPTQVTWRFAVQGMHCDGCADGIRSELLRVEGVQVAKVSFKEGTALVTAEPRQVTVARVMQVIDEAGYTATRIAP